MNKPDVFSDFYKSKMSKAHLHLQLKVERENLKADINASSSGRRSRPTALTC